MSQEYVLLVDNDEKLQDGKSTSMDKVLGSSNMVGVISDFFSKPEFKSAAETSKTLHTVLSLSKSYLHEKAAFALNELIKQINTLPKGKSTLNKNKRKQLSKLWNDISKHLEPTSKVQLYFLEVILSKKLQELSVTQTKVKNPLKISSAVFAAFLGLGIYELAPFDDTNNLVSVASTGVISMLVLLFIGHQGNKLHNTVATKHLFETIHSSIENFRKQCLSESNPISQEDVTATIRAGIPQ